MQITQQYGIMIAPCRGEKMNELERSNSTIQAPRAAEAVVAGHICLDVIPTLVGGGVVFMPGQTVEAGPAVFASGGPVSNTGLALHKLGVSTRLMGKAGDDLFGQAILRIIESHGPRLAEGMVVVPGEYSSYSIILSSPNTDRMLIHAPGCNATFGADDIRYDALEQVRLFHFGYPPLMERMYADNGAELATIFRRVKAIGITTSLDLSMPDPNSAAGRADWHAILGATLPYVDIFLPSAEEILLMLRRPLFDELATQAKGSRPLEQMGRCRVAGEAAWSDRELWAPCFAAQVAGTTGSGDATIAGFLAGLLRGMGPEEPMLTACAVGACSVEAVDALSGIRSWPETVERIAAGWPRIPLALNGSNADWRWDSTHEIWMGPKDIHALPAY